MVKVAETLLNQRIISTTKSSQVKVESTNKYIYLSKGKKVGENYIRPTCLVDKKAVPFFISFVVLVLNVLV